MRDMLKQLVRSKKAWATLVAIVVWVAGRAGWDVPAEELEKIVFSLGAYVIGQGVADAGKHRAP